MAAELEGLNELSTSGYVPTNAHGSTVGPTRAGPPTRMLRTNMCGSCGMPLKHRRRMREINFLKFDSLYSNPIQIQPENGPQK
eukprot:393272-Pleurochrysis_carterae.AAC.3